MTEINGHALTTALERISANSTRFESALRVLASWLAPLQMTLFVDDEGYWIVTLSADLTERVPFPSFSLAFDFALKEAEKRLREVRP